MLQILILCSGLKINKNCSIERRLDEGPGTKPLCAGGVFNY